MRFHLFPFRTQKLSSHTPTILGWQRPGKIGSRRDPKESLHRVALFFYAKIFYNELVKPIVRGESMSRTENVELAVLCLLTDGNKILLQNRVKQDWHGYALPGGHVEPGESFVDAVKREMKEETGLDVLSPKLVGVKQFPITNGRYVVLLFKADSFQGSLVSSEEGKMEWIDRDQLTMIGTVDDFAELLTVMESAELSEFQYIVEGDCWTVSLK